MYANAYLHFIKCSYQHLGKYTHRWFAMRECSLINIVPAIWIRPKLKRMWKLGDIVAQVALQRLVFLQQHEIFKEFVSHTCTPDVHCWSDADKSENPDACWFASLPSAVTNGCSAHSRWSVAHARHYAAYVCLLTVSVSSHISRRSNCVEKGTNLGCKVNLSLHPQRN